MTPLQKASEGLNHRQIGYARARFEGLGQLDAHAKAGYSQGGNKNVRKVQASRLENNPKVVRFIDHLRETANNQSVVTREQLVGHLLEHREIALEDGQVGAANQAVMGVAKIMGLEINKSEVTHTHTYEVEQATQELFNMLSRRGKAPAKMIDVTPDDTD